MKSSLLLNLAQPKKFGLQKSSSTVAFTNYDLGNTHGFSAKKNAPKKFRSNKLLPKIEPSSLRSTLKSNQELAPRADSTNCSPSWSTLSQSPKLTKEKKRSTTNEVLLMQSGSDFLNQLKNLEKQHTVNNCLKKHKVTADLRARMVDWINEVLRILQEQESTGFLATAIMDRYLSTVEKTLGGQDMHIMAIVCMTLASKYNAIDGISLDIAHEAIGHGNFPKEEIFKKELEILQVLGFRMETATVYDFLQFYSSILVVEKFHDDIMKLALYYAKVNTFDYENCGILPSLQAAGCLLLALRTHQIIKKVYTVDDELLQALSEMSGHSLETIEKSASLADMNSKIFHEKFPSCDFFVKNNKETIKLVTLKKARYN